MRTIIEPFRIKVVEPIHASTVEERTSLLERSGYNLFQVPARAVIVDLLTDSGTGAMSAEQWATMMHGDESYAGSDSYYRLQEAACALTGFATVLPVHQGRAAERIVFGLLGGPGQVIPGNTHFDTTRANIEATGARAVDLPVRDALHAEVAAPFKGNLDVGALRAVLARRNVPCVVVTITNNALGGHPVQLENLHAVRELCVSAGVPLLLDAARFAENAYLARERDVELRDLTVAEVAQAYFELSDGFLMSAKKDVLCNTGGLFALRDTTLLERARTAMIATEGFPTYGGLAGRDLEAIARGLGEATDPEYLGYRAGAAAYLARGLEQSGVPFVRPLGLHAVYVDAGAFLPHVPAASFPGHALAVELYRRAGIRSCEVGTLLRGEGHGGLELLRLALPRRVYTQSHIDYVIEAFAEIAAQRERIPGYRVVTAPPVLRHFSARLQPGAGA